MLKLNWFLVCDKWWQISTRLSWFTCSFWPVRLMKSICEIRRHLPNRRHYVDGNERRAAQFLLKETVDDLYWMAIPKLKFLFCILQMLDYKASNADMSFIIRRAAFLMSRYRCDVVSFTSVCEYCLRNRSKKELTICYIMIARSKKLLVVGFSNVIEIWNLSLIFQQYPIWL